MESETIDMIIKNVKIDKMVFMETYICEEWLQLLKECHNHCQEDKKEFIYVYCLLSLQEEFENEDQWALKKGVTQNYGFWRESSQTKVVATIKKCSGGCVSFERWKHSGI